MNSVVFLFQSVQNEGIPEILLKWQNALNHWYYHAEYFAHVVGLVWVTIIFGMAVKYSGTPLFGFLVGVFKAFLLLGVNNNLFFCDDIWPYLVGIFILNFGVLFFLFIRSKKNVTDTLLEMTMTFFVHKFNLFSLIFDYFQYLLFYFITFVIFNKGYSDFPELGEHLFSFDNFLKSIFPICP